MKFIKASKLSQSHRKAMWNLFSSFYEINKDVFFKSIPNDAIVVFLK